MSFHPEEQRGWSEKEACPYCGCEDFDYIDDEGMENSVAATFSIETCRCKGCYKIFNLVSVVERSFYGVYKGVEE